MSGGSNLPIPGSLLLLELENPSEAGGVGAVKDVVLSPKPSNDVNDPLNWSWKRKQVAHLMVVIYTLTSGIACCSLNSVLVPISVQTGIRIGTLVEGTGYMFLLLGWGGLITQPLALTFGKRPVYLMSQIGNLATVIWMIYIKSEGEWLANKVVQGFFASPIESLVEVSIADVFFAHERGSYIGIYGMVLFGGNFLAPVFSGFINDSIGKDWVFWVTAIQIIIGTIIMFFFMEETNYNRGTSEMVEKHDVDASGQVVSNNDLASPGLAEKDTQRDLTQHRVESVELDGQEYSFFQKLRMFNQKYTSNKVFFQMMYRPFLHLRFPVVVWSGVLYGTALIWYNVLNATASVIFSGPPFGFSASMVGLTYLGPMIGSIAAFGWSGYAADKWLMYYTRKKGGIREPEHRLWLLALNAIICPVGLILWGVGAGRGIHWFGLVFGGSMVAFTSATGGAFAINYALDSYKDLSGEVMITVILIRNTMSFAVSYGITPWVTMGYQSAFIIAALVGLAFYASFILVIKYGKKWRAASREVYWRYVESSVMSHI